VPGDKLAAAMLCSGCPGPETRASTFKTIKVRPKRIKCQLIAAVDKLEAPKVSESEVGFEEETPAKAEQKGKGKARKKGKGNG